MKKLITKYIYVTLHILLIQYYILDIGRSVYHFFAIFQHTNEIHNVPALIVY